MACVPVCLQDNPGAAFDKVQRSSSKKALRENSSIAISIKSSSNGYVAEQGQQPRSSARGAAAYQGLSWLMVAVAVAVWQVHHL
jgi:hypothetical protein